MKRFITAFIVCITVTNICFSQNDTIVDEEYPTRGNTSQDSETNDRYRPIKRKIIRGFSFQAENDVFAKAFLLKNEDKDYSGGFKFEFYTDYLSKGILPFFMNRDDPYEMSKNVNSVYIQGMGYTPNRDAFSETMPVTDQRPYSSLIGIGRKRIAIFENPFRQKTAKGLILISDLFLGRIGTQGPGKVQNFLHEYLTKSDEVKGWHNQIANGGKFIYNYNLSSSYELWKSKNECLFAIVTPHVSVGNLFVNQGLKLAISNLTVKKQPFTLSMNSSQVAKEEDKIQKAKTYDSVLLRKEKQRKVYFEFYGKFYHISHNTLLMGMPFKDNSIYTIPKDRLNLFIFDIGGKIYVPYFPDKTKGKTMKRKNLFYFEILYRSKEFDIAPTHFYGGLGIQILSLD